MTATEAGRRAGRWAGRPWRGARRLSSRTPLRTKLIAALLALVVVALAVISFVSITQLRGYLVGRADQQLQQESSRLTGHGLGFGNSSGLQIATNMVAQLYTTSGQFVGNVNAAGYVVSQTPPNVDFPASTSWLKANANTYVTVNAQPDGSWRAYTVLIQYNTNSSGYLVTASDLSSVYTTARQLTGVDLIVSIVIVFVMALAGFVVVRSNLRPLVEIEETAGEIADGHLNLRVPEGDPRTEIGSLGRSLNTMLSQIETAFHAREESEAAAHQSEERMRRFIADASHELRTPLTAIRGFAEYYRQRGGIARHESQDQADLAGAGLTPDDLDRIMQRVEKEAARMGLLVEDLLLLARLDQQRPLAQQPIDILSLAADAVHDTRMLAPNRTIGLSVAPGAAFLVTGDEARLRQVIGNLMSNALTHTPDGTPIEVSISSGILDPRVDDATRAVILDITDHGPGMTADQAHRVFERFYRADQARTRATGGSGLGLAIVSALVSAHGGVASVRTAEGRGATFRVTLPLAPEAHDTTLDDDPDSFGMMDDSELAYETDEAGTKKTGTTGVIETAGTGGQAGEAGRAVEDQGGENGSGTGRDGTGRDGTDRDEDLRGEAERSRMPHLT